MHNFTLNQNWKFVRVTLDPHHREKKKIERASYPVPFFLSRGEAEKYVFLLAHARHFRADQPRGRDAPGAGRSADARGARPAARNLLQGENDDKNAVSSSTLLVTLETLARAHTGNLGNVDHIYLFVVTNDKSEV